MIIGEIPKLFIMLGIAYILGVLKLTILTYIMLLPYKYFVGGVHAKSNLISRLVYFVYEMRKIIYEICHFLFRK